MVLSIIKAALAVGISPYLLLGVCDVESNLRNISGDKGKSIGICQVQKRTAKHMDVDPEKLWNPDINALAAAKYLKYNMKRYPNNDYCVLSAYNAGYCTDKNNKYIIKVNKRIIKWERKLKK